MAELFGAKWLFGGGVLVTAIFTLITPLVSKYITAKLCFTESIFLFQGRRKKIVIIVTSLPKKRYFKISSSGVQGSKGGRKKPFFQGAAFKPLQKKIENEMPIFLLFLTGCILSEVFKNSNFSPVHPFLSSQFSYFLNSLCWPKITCLTWASPVYWQTNQPPFSKTLKHNISVKFILDNHVLTYYIIIISRQLQFVPQLTNNSTKINA